MRKYVFAISIAINIFCCHSGKIVAKGAEKASKGVIIYHGDRFFVFKLKNEKMSIKSVTWDYLYSNIEHTGYALNGIPSNALDNLFSSFRGIALNVPNESIKKEFKYLYLVPVIYKLSFIDTTTHNTFKSRKFNLNFMYKQVPYFDFNYQSYLVDTCYFSLWENFKLSPDFSLGVDSMLPLIKELPPGIFKN